MSGVDPAKRYVKWIYLAVVAVLMLPTFVFFSAYMASKGVHLPWVYESHTNGYTNYTVNALAALLFAVISAIAFTFLVDRMAERRGNSYYYYGLIVVIVVVALAALAIYGGACGVCAAVACNWKVEECGIVWKNLFEVKIKCLCK